jgi:hypothetical protein
MFPAAIALKDQFRLSGGEPRTLLDNAVKYSPPGEITIDIHADAGQTELRIRDYGPGIGLQLGAFHRAVMADVQVVIMGDGHHRGGHVALLAVINMAASVVAISHDHYLNIRHHGAVESPQIVGGEARVGEAVIGELYQTGGGAADAIEARLLAGGRASCRLSARPASTSGSLWAWWRTNSAPRWR